MATQLPAWINRQTPSHICNGGPLRTLLEESEARLRHGVPLRLDQQVGLLSQGYDVGAIEDGIEAETELVGFHTIGGE